MGRQLYATEEPKLELEKRIQYTFNLYNNAVNVLLLYLKNLQFKNQNTCNQRDKEDEDNIDDLFNLVDDDFDF